MTIEQLLIGTIVLGIALMAAGFAWRWLGARRKR